MDTIWDTSVASNLQDDGPDKAVESDERVIRGVFLHKGDAVHQVQSTLVTSTAGTTMQDVCQEQWDECQLISEVFSALTRKEETNGPTMGHSPGDYDGNTLSNLIEGHSMMGSSLKGMPLESASGSCRGITGGTLSPPTGTSPQLPLYNGTY
jgi:hypothetical protein